jgi:glucokinase
MYIGIDIGGTGIDAGAFADGQLITRSAAPVLPGDSQEALLRRLRALVLQVAGSAENVRGIGVGVPGSVDSARGLVLFTSNLPLGGADIGAVFSDFDVPVLLENDANCAALGERNAPGRENVRDMVFVTIGTGVGGGVIVGGRPYAGWNGAAGEVGHMVVERGGRACGCGRSGCWERYASATGLVLSACDAMERNCGSSMWTMCGNDLSRVDAKLPFQAAKSGDAVALEVVREYWDYLACGLANIVNIFQPELLVLGGGVAREPDDWFLNPLRERISREEFRHGGARARVERARLGPDAGVYGAAALALV